MFDYPLLQALLAIEREGSFENAAKAMEMSKSAISQKIGLLEQRLGAPVLERNPARPTAFGKSLCRHFELVQLLESALFADHGHHFRMRPTGIAVLRLAVNDGMPSRCLLDVLDPLPDGKSNFCLDIVFPQNGNAIDSLRNGNATAAISTTNARPLISRYGEVQVHSLGALTFVAAASPDFAARTFPEGISRDAVAMARNASFDADNGLNSRFISEQLGMPVPGPSYRIPSMPGMLNIVLEGCAWAVLPLYLVRKHLEVGNLVDLSPGQELSVELFWHIPKYLDELPLDITDTIRFAANRLGSMDETESQSR